MSSHRDQDSLPFDRVYVISLPGSADRRSHIASHLPKAGLPRFEFHNAIGPDDEEVQRAYAENRVATFPPCFRCGKTECGKDECNNVLIPQQVAVFLTYCTLWEKIAARRECALVCEDDVLLHPWWRDVMAMIASRRSSGQLRIGPDDPALIRLGWAENAEHTRDRPLHLSREVRMSNPCHIVTSAYARMLLDECRRIEHTADVFVHRDSNAARNFAWTAHPPAATELSWSRGEVDSLIHPKPVRSEYLRRMGREREATENDARIADHVHHLFHRTFLIVGHPRCGTGFTANLLSQMGFDVGHEADGRDGLASWMFAVDGPAPYAKDRVAQRRDTLRWKTLIMPVRDIETAIPSIMRDNTFSFISYDFRRKHIAKAGGGDLNALPNNFHRAVVSFLHWNRLVEAMHPDLVFRIERDQDRLHAFARSHAQTELPSLDRLNLSPFKADKPYKGRRRPKPNVTSQDWASLPESLWDEVVAYCHKQDYALPDRSSSRQPLASAPKVPMDNLERMFCGPSGWARSMAEQVPVRADGRPLPWFTYGAIEFLERVARHTDRVFEYGAGYSTLWWQDRVRSVTSVEHDGEWIERIRPQLGVNVRLDHVNQYAPCPEGSGPIIDEYRRRMRRTVWPNYDVQKVIRRGLQDEGFEGYAASIMEHDEPLDIVVVDGMARRMCCAFAIQKLSPDGIVVLDNSNRRDYDAAYDILEEADFRQIPFWGLVPGASFMTCTSIFVRDISRIPTASFCPNSHGIVEY